MLDEGGSVMNGEQKSLSSLPASEVIRINERSIREFDSRYKNKCNISSGLDRYEDGVIYLKIVNMKTHFPSNYVTALRFAREWKSLNEEEFGQAKGFVVLFCGADLTVETGWPVERRHPQGSSPCWYDPSWHNRVENALSEWKAKELDGIFSGLFEEQSPKEPNAEEIPEE
jgi:hypothetical protein